MAALIINNPPPIPRQFAAPTVGYMLGEQAMADRYTPAAEGPKVDDVHVQSSTYGAPILIPYGVFKTAGNLIWADTLIPGMTRKWVDLKTKTEFPSVPTYLCSFAVALCEGPIYGVRRIWADGKLMYDRTVQNKGVKSIFRVDGIKVYIGDEDQMPDPLIEKAKRIEKGLPEDYIPGPDEIREVPAFRGMAYVVFNRLELLKFGNRIPNLVFEVLTKGSAEYEPPFRIGRGDFGAIDPETGYLWTTGQWRDQLSYDPVTKTNTWGSYYSYVDVYDLENKVRISSQLLPQVHLPISDFIGNGMSGDIKPAGILYEPVNKNFIISGGSGLTNFGWLVNAATGIPIPDQTLSSAFFWPGVSVYTEVPPTTGQVAIVSQNGIAWGIGGVFQTYPGGGWNFDPSQGFDTPIGWTFHEMHSPDYQYQFTWGFASAITCNGTLIPTPIFMSAAHVVWDEINQGVWLASQNSPEICFYAVGDTEARVVYTLTYYDTLTLEERKTISPIAVERMKTMNAIGISGLWYSPDTNQLYIQSNDLVGLAGPTSVAVFSASPTALVPLDEIYPGGVFLYYEPTDPNYNLYGPIKGTTGAGVVMGGIATSAYIGDETWWMTNAGIVWIVKFQGAMIAEPILLKEVVGDISDRVKLPAVRYDVEQLIDVVDGFGITSTTSGRVAVESLMPYYFFDSVESDGKVKFVKRGQTPKISISSEDLVDRSKG